MKTLVLAAGLGTHLGHLTQHFPPPMLPIGGKPLLEHILDLLHRHALTDVAINLHDRPDVILRHFGSGEKWGIHLRYSYEATLLGTAGTALRQLAWVYPDPFVVYYGDVYSNINLAELIELHRSGSAVATIAVHAVDDPSRYGMVEFDNTGFVRRFVEKPTPKQAHSRWASSGIYVLQPSVLRYVSDIPSDFGRDVFPRLLDAGERLQVYPVDGPVIDIGTPENYQRAQRLFAAPAAQPHPAPRSVARTDRTMATT